MWIMHFGDRSSFDVPVVEVGIRGIDHRSDRHPM